MRPPRATADDVSALELSDDDGVTPSAPKRVPEGTRAEPSPAAKRAATGEPREPLEPRALALAPLPATHHPLPGPAGALALGPRAVGDGRDEGATTALVPSPGDTAFGGPAWLAAARLAGWAGDEALEGGGLAALARAATPGRAPLPRKRAPPHVPRGAPRRGRRLPAPAPREKE